MRGRDKKMRLDGFVTAAEVAEATGEQLGTIHHGIETGAIPGEKIKPEGAKYASWYVNIQALLDSGRYKPDGAGATIFEALKKLADLTRKPETAKPKKPAKKGRAAVARQ